MKGAPTIYANSTPQPVRDGGPWGSQRGPGDPAPLMEEWVARVAAKSTPKLEREVGGPWMKIPEEPR